MVGNEVTKGASPNWKRPEEVMKFHRLKQRKRALSARMSGNDSVSSMSFSQSSNSEDSLSEFPAAKRRNPFAKRLEALVSNKQEELTDESGIETDMSSDTMFFNFLNSSQSIQPPVHALKSFANILQHLNHKEDTVQCASSPEKPKPKQKDGLRIPIDWSIKNKVRFMSSKSFSWSGTLRTCEEASGITGFVRCLNMNHTEDKIRNCSLDTSPNARFHQCCLYWQHPNLPWLQLFPRSNLKISPALVTAQIQMAPSLLTEWTTAFKSLFQLVRARQCPFFYLIANHFHCLFRAAGIAGIPETHAIITPTTRGFRKTLDDEDVVYTMPLKKKRKSNEFASDSDNSLLIEPEELSGGDDDDDDWLESMGVDSKEMKRLTSSQKTIDRTRERKIDGSNESVVVIQGVNVLALFNLLVNCKSCVATSGPMAGVPPTLLSPTAFQLATMKSCKVRDTMVRVDGCDFHSIQVEGPILPHALRQMCLLLEQDKLKFSASLTTIRQTIGFTQASKNLTDEENKPASASVFLKENLTDCGLVPSLLNVFCDQDVTKMRQIHKSSTDSNIAILMLATYVIVLDDDKCTITSRASNRTHLTPNTQAAL